MYAHNCEGYSLTTGAFKAKCSSSKYAQMAEEEGVPMGTEQRSTLSQAATDVPFRNRVLLKLPETKNIPLFALGWAHKLFPVPGVLSGSEEVRKHVSTAAAEALDAAAYGDHQLIFHRYVSELRDRTALYTIWMGFRQRQCAEKYVHDFPKYGLASIAKDADAQALKAAIGHRANVYSDPDPETRLKRAYAQIMKDWARKGTRYYRSDISMLWTAVAKDTEVDSVG